MSQSSKYDEIGYWSEIKLDIIKEQEGKLMAANSAIERTEATWNPVTGCTNIQKVFSVMKQAQQHIFQVLTKRSENLRKLSTSLPWPDNVWMGVTVENNRFLKRIEDLRNTPAKVKFVSFEPLLSPISNINLTNIDWVIAGGESGPKARPMSSSWVKDIRNQCVAANVPFFFKQWGGTNKKKAGRMLDGRTWDEMPEIYKKSVKQDKQKEG
jgi:protein gp37